MSSGHSPTYIDGVPVKISEKYKPPPPISVPSGLFEKVSSLSDTIRTVNYDFTLENNVLCKLDEWRNARERIKTERNLRIQLKEEARQRELDKIAASVNEEKRKQLSVSEVSYPSTEEISEISPDDSVECDNLVYHKHNEISSKNEQFLQISNFLPEQTISENNSSDILQPIPAPEGPFRINLLDDLDSITRLQESVRKKSNKFSQSKFSYNKSDVDKLSFSDFENDTSSPFDNLELKTINDIELLAQVLNVQPTISNTEMKSNESYPVSMSQIYKDNLNMNGILDKQLYSELNHPPVGSDTISGISSYMSNVPISIVNSNNIYPVTTNCISIANGHYDYNSQKPSYNIDKNNRSNMNSYYGQSYNYNNTNSLYSQYIPETVKNDNQVFNDYNCDKNIYNHVINDPYKFSNVDYTAHAFDKYFTSEMKNQSDNIENTSNTLDTVNNQIVSKSRSRSVPDIVKELNEEIEEARLKARMRNCSPGPYCSFKTDPSSSKLSNVENLPNPYDILSPEMQSMCKNINGMGFPLDRVARACDSIGNDDKKIIEYLLIMGQLMDLGFPESKVSKALLQHNCNRDKALDELIS